VWLFAGIAVSNPAEGKDPSTHGFLVCCVGSGLCDELITRTEESYYVCLIMCIWVTYVCVCVCVCGCAGCARVCLIVFELEISIIRQPR
jgi:hypothetical protein